MSRIGKQPVILPKGIKARLEGSVIFLESPKGALSFNIPNGISIKLDAEKITVERSSNEKKIKSLHGTARAIVNNMVKGLSEGFKKELEIIGVGYKALLKAKTLVLNLGFSHQINMDVPADLKITLPLPTRLVIEGVDRQKVGEFTARIRKIFPPEPYKGKGVRYVGEVVRKKLGKALAKSA